MEFVKDTRQPNHHYLKQDTVLDKKDATRAVFSLTGMVGTAHVVEPI